jgi:Na+(H+)/acetate symporter ActP
VDTSRLRAIERLNLVIAAAICLGSLIFWRRGVTFGALLGAALAVLNFWAIRRTSEAGLKTKSERKKLVLISLLIAKMGAVMGLVYVIIRYAPINVLAFIVGFSTFLVSIMIVSFRGMGHAAET